MDAAEAAACKRVSRRLLQRAERRLSALDASAAQLQRASATGSVFHPGWIRLLDYSTIFAGVPLSTHLARENEL